MKMEFQFALCYKTNIYIYNKTNIINAGFAM